MSRDLTYLTDQVDTTVNTLSDGLLKQNEEIAAKFSRNSTELMAQANVLKSNMKTLRDTTKNGHISAYDLNAQLAAATDLYMANTVYTVGYDKKTANYGKETVTVQSGAVTQNGTRH